MSPYRTFILDVSVLSPELRSTTSVGNGGTVKSIQSSIDCASFLLNEFVSLDK
jgi:hypothetical protein